MNLPSYEYIAGFFDGEGNISVKAKTGRQPQVVLNITQKRRRVLDLIRQRLISDDITCGQVNVKGVDIHYMQIGNSLSVERFLELVKPYLIVNREECERALTVLSNRDTSRDKFTSDKLRTIKALLDKGVPTKEVAVTIGMDRSYLYRLRRKFNLTLA